MLIKKTIISKSDHMHHGPPFYMAGALDDFVHQSLILHRLELAAGTMVIHFTRWYGGSFYAGFKNNPAYDRFWEGRKVWGAIVNSSRM